MISITIPGQPCAKGRPRIGKTRSGQPVAFTPAKTRSREGVVASLAMDIMAGRPPVSGPVEVVVTAVMEIPKSKSKHWKADALAGRILPTGRPDLDNLIKLVTDGCNGIVWGDDAQIVTAVARKMYGTPARTIISIAPVTP